MLESGRIDPGYAGSSIAETIEAIERITAMKKGEFESTSNFNVRKNVSLLEKFLGDSSIEETFAFVSSVTKGEKYISGLRYYFNADTGYVNLFVLPASSENIYLNGIRAPDYATNRRESNGLDKFEFSTKIESKRTYQAGNAYGATITVEETVLSRLGLAVNRVSFLDFKRDLVYSNPSSTHQFTLENSRAAQELPALKVMIVMRLTDPYLVYNFVHVGPKRDNPVDISVREKFLTGNVIGLVFYSGLTGEIFARLPENFGKVEPKPEDKLAGQ